MARVAARCELSEGLFWYACTSADSSVSLRAGETVSDNAMQCGHTGRKSANPKTPRTVQHFTLTDARPAHGTPSSDSEELGTLFVPACR